jgi:hypothetical protein
MQNKNLIDNLLSLQLHKYHRLQFGEKEYILSDQLMSEVINNNIKDIVNYELSRCKKTEQKIFK